MRTVHPLRQYYESYHGEKCSFNTFWQRVSNYKWEMEDALQPAKPRNKYTIDDNGRTCRLCNTYKTWEAYTLDSTSKHKKMSVCRDCSIQAHKDYRSTPLGKQKTKNYRIIYRANPEKRKYEWQKHKEWVEENRERVYTLAKEYKIKNKHKIDARRKEREEEIFYPWNKVLYSGKIVTILAVKKWLWCLCKINEMRIWIWKYRLKPVANKRKLDIMDSARI